jgi:hypothetical protein
VVDRREQPDATPRQCGRKPLDRAGDVGLHVGDYQGRGHDETPSFLDHRTGVSGASDF